MIRFPCSNCQAPLKAPDTKSGKSVKCPRCKMRAHVPGPIAIGSLDDDGRADDRAAAAASAPPQPTPTKALDQLIGDMSTTIKVLLGIVLGMGLIALSSGFILRYVNSGEAAEGLGTSEKLCFAFSGLCVLGLLTILYGYGTSCPACGQWWSKQEKDKDLVDSRAFYKTATGERIYDAGVGRPEGAVGKRHVRVTYDNHLGCRCCEHTWSIKTVDEYQKEAAPKPRADHGGHSEPEPRERSRQRLT